MIKIFAPSPAKSVFANFGECIIPTAPILAGIKLFPVWISHAQK